MTEWYKYSNDTHIDFGHFTYPCYLAWVDASETLDQILKAKEKTSRIVVVTHSCPTPVALPSPDSKYYSLCGSYYNSIMNRLITSNQFVMNDSIRAWIYGHDHIPFDKHINGCRFVNNPFGYSMELPGRKRGIRTIEV